MPSFEKLYSMGHEQVTFFSDPSCGLKAIVCIHNTVLGPALGGTRLWNYKNEEEALEDALRLSRGMSYKAAISGLNLGGGKAVIIADPNNKSEELFRSYGRFIESLNGRYITAEDVNTTVQDMEYMFNETSHVVGVSKNNGGSGNPSPYTALGVFRGIEAACTKVFGNRSVKGKVVAIQGAGQVGRYLGKDLYEAGAKVIYTDINQTNIEQFREFVPNAQLVGPEEIYDVQCDIFSPNALGATINDNTINRLKCKIVAGGANNQLKEDRHGKILQEKKILYAPDYLINAGGLMNVSLEYEGWSDEKSTQMVNTIYDKTMEVFTLAERENIPVNKAADLKAEKRIEAMRKIKSNHLGHVDPRYPGAKRR